MKELEVIQRAFQESLQQENDSVTHHIKKPKNMTEADCFQIYSNDYFFQLRDSLKEDYEKTHNQLGPSEFNDLVALYLKQYPSATYTLREIGLQFPSFLKENDQDPAIVELAFFECEMMKALYVEDKAHLSLEDLSMIEPEAWENLTFKLHPSARKISVLYNTTEFFGGLNNQEQLHPRLLENPLYILIWRHGMSVYFRELDEKENALFEAISSVKSFSEICEEMLVFLTEENVIPWIAANLQTWISDQLFLKVD